MTAITQIHAVLDNQRLDNKRVAAALAKLLSDPDLLEHALHSTDWADFAEEHRVRKEWQQFDETSGTWLFFDESDDGKPMEARDVLDSFLTCGTHRLRGSNTWKTKVEARRQTMLDFLLNK